MEKRAAFAIWLGLLALLGARASIAGTTHLFRHESSFLRDSDVQLNHGWWVRDTDRLQTQVYGFYETSTNQWLELNLTAGPIVRTSWGWISFPVGVRFRPEDDWDVSHAITKANVFGRVGDYPLFLVNDLSWALHDGRNEHFLQYQWAWQPRDHRLGIGIQSDRFSLGWEEISWAVGPVLKVTYHEDADERRTWLGTLDVFPFYDLTTGDVGVKFNFITLRLGG